MYSLLIGDSVYICCWPNSAPATSLRLLIIWLHLLVMSVMWWANVTPVSKVTPEYFSLIRVRCWAIVECDRGSVSMFESVAGQECGSGQWGHFESIMCE